MAYDFTFFRDRIVLDNAFTSKLKLDSLPFGTTILIAAREMSVAGTFELHGRNLVLLADRFDGTGGAVRMQGAPDGSAGPPRRKPRRSSQSY